MKVDKDSIRPAGKDDECFYCNRLIGQEHTDKCVLNEANKTPCVACIRQNATGKVVRYHTELFTPQGYDGLFIWEEGNYLCDCNRAIFFCDDDIPCGEGKYSVNIEVDGEVIYREYEAIVNKELERMK